MNKFESMGASLANFAIRRPVTICMLFFSLLMLGLIASRLLPLEKWPGIDIPEMVVHIPYKDATPTEVETMITRPVEEALATMSGITRLQSRSNEDAAEIYIEFKWDENLKAKSIEAREKVDAIRHTLPTDVERVLVYQFNTNDAPIFQLRVSSARDLSNAYDLLDRNLKKPLERVQGVSKVEFYGVLEKQIAIRLLSDRISAFRLDPNELALTLQSANFSMNAGHFFDAEQKILVKPIGEFQDIQAVKELYVGTGITLGDIAEITYETPRRTEGRHLDRTYAVGFNIFREAGANLVETSERVLTVIDQANSNPAFNGINLFVMQDEADSVTESLSNLLSAGLLGALLSILVLYAFLKHFASTMIVVLSVPFSICIALGCMYFMGYSLNVLSLMGLMLAVGMLVDNAVVITESIYQEKEHIKNSVEATKAGVAKVSLAVIAGTATTAIVFLPNIVGKKVNVTVFLEHVAIAICISLFASLLIAQTLIPLLTTKIKQPPERKDSKFARFQEFYAKVLHWTLTHQGKTALIAIGVVIISVIGPMQNVSNDDDNQGSQEQIWLNYDIQGNYTLDEVEDTVDKMEAYLYANQDEFHLKSVYSYYTPGFAVSGLRLKEDLPITLADLKKRIKERFPSFVRARPSFQWDNGGNGVRLTLLGQSSDTLNTIAERIVPILENIDGLTDVKSDINGQKLELQLSIDRQKAFRFGLNAEDVSNVVTTALRGSNLRTLRNAETGEIDIRLMFDHSIQRSLEQLKNLPVKWENGQQVTLDMVADFNVTPRVSEIRRYYRQTALSIGANLENDVTMEQARERIEGVMQHLNLPTGYSWTLDGGFRRQQENEAVMQVNMLLAVAMIYVVMAALFESLLLPTAVITSLLFAYTGVFWILFITGTPMSIMAMIGMLILMGIVVNNGIVLVDRINHLIDEGLSVHDAIIEGGKSRIRPIVMTVATTVLGLLPLALGDTQIAGDGPPYAPMAIAIIGGLVFSTLTSLMLLPLIYLLLLKLRRKTSNMIADSKALVSRWVKA